jgi:hypothetical protein
VLSATVDEREADAVTLADTVVASEHVVLADCVTEFDAVSPRDADAVTLGCHVVDAVGSSVMLRVAVDVGSSVAESDRRCVCVSVAVALAATEFECVPAVDAVSGDDTVNSSVGVVTVSEFVNGVAVRVGVGVAIATDAAQERLTTSVITARRWTASESHVMSRVCRTVRLLAFLRMRFVAVLQNTNKNWRTYKFGTGDSAAEIFMEKG